MRVAAGVGLALGAIALALATRVPLLALTHRLPVSNDDAIPLLMARHVLRGELSTILWNQPYNGALDAYLLAPALLLGPPHAVFRAYEVLCAVLLVAAIGLAGRALGGPSAGAWAALLAAVGTPYMALMAATGPTPNFLVPLLVVVPLLVGLSRLDAPPRGPAAAALAGLVSGLAIWDSALALPSLIGVGAGLVAAGSRPRAPTALACAAGLALGAGPLLVARAVGASASSPVTDVRPRWLWADGLADLWHAGAGLVGLQVPLVVDGPERAALPVPLALCLGTALAAAVALGLAGRRVWPLVGWALALGAAFTLSRRTGADEVRYLYGLNVPLLALAGAGLSRAARRARAAPLALAFAIIVPWATGHAALLRAWGDPAHAARVWEVPPLEPVLDTLSRAGVRSAYASLQFAGRLALESDGRLIASQAWNERVPGDPLRFRDEVDLDPRPAWVLSSRLSRGMPRAGGFRELLGGLGGSWREDLPADFVVFRRFAPPYDESRAVPAEELMLSTTGGEDLPPAVLDRDVATAWTSPLGLARGSGIVLRPAAPRRLSAIVLAVDLDRSPLAVPWVCEMDGVTVAEGPARHGLQWVNGAPRAGRQALLAIPLPSLRPVAEVRVLFQDNGPPLVVAEAFAYGPDEPPTDDAGAAFAEQGLDHARQGRWSEAVAAYAEAARRAPDRASHHACLARARWRAARRARLDVESLADGGRELVLPRRP
ncbi:MAG TPA: hypothetical protein VMT87_11710 [Vicinamibacteria bacterium]|nr:hypothetical protein [Vicinamibacteria bacterium]